MMEPLHEDVATRIGAMEKQLLQLKRDCRRLLSLLGLVLLAVGALVTLGANMAGQREAIESEEFVVRGRDGKIRASFGLRADGMTSLIFSDNRGKERFTLGVMPDGSPGLSLSDPNGKERLTLGTFPDGSVHLTFSDQNERERLGMGTNADGNPSLTAFDDNEKARLIVGFRQDKTIKLQLIGQDQKTGLIIGTKANGESVLAACDGSLGYKMALAFSKDRRGMLSFMDREGNIRVNLDEEGLGVFDKGGEARIAVGDDENFGSRIEMFHGDGKPKISTSVDNRGVSTMTIDGKQVSTISK